MITVPRAAFALVFSLGIVALIIGLGPGRSSDTPDVPNPAVPPAAKSISQAQPEGTGSKDQASKEEVKPEAPSKPKVLTMAEAVTLAERLGKGQAVKAERKDRPVPSFKIEVLGLDGVKRQIELRADGTQLSNRASEPKIPGKKKRPKQ